MGGPNCEHLTTFNFEEYDDDRDLYLRHYYCLLCGKEIAAEYVNLASIVKLLDEVGSKKQLKKKIMEMREEK